MKRLSVLGISSLWVWMCLFLLLPFAALTVHAADQVLWADDFEGGDFGSPKYYIDGLWHATDAQSSFSRSYSGNSSAWFGSETTGTYETSGYGYFTTGEVDITATGEVEFSVEYLSWEETEGVDGRDLRKVYYKLNCAGCDWVMAYRSYQHLCGWHKVTFNFTETVGVTDKIQLAFEFDSNGSANNHYAGWYIDNLYFKALESRKTILSGKEENAKEKQFGRIPPKARLGLEAKQDIDKNDCALEAVPDDRYVIPALNGFGIVIILLVIGWRLRNKINGRGIFLLLFLILGNIFIDLHEVNAWYVYDQIGNIMPDGMDDDRPEIAISDQWVVMVWETSLGNDTRIAFSTFDRVNGGIWSAKQIISFDGCSHFREPDVDWYTSDSDEFWIVWDAENGTGVRNVYCCRYNAQTGNQTIVQVNSTEYDSCMEASVCGESGSRRVVYTVLASGARDIYSSSWNGSSWNTMEKVNCNQGTPVSQCMDPVALKGMVAFSAIDSTGSREIFVTYGTAFGCHWVAPILISDTSNNYPESQVEGTTVYVNGYIDRRYFVWTRDRSGLSDDSIIFREVSSAGQPVGTPTTLGFPSGGCGWPSITYDHTYSIINVVVTKENAGLEKYRLYMGKLNRQTPTPSWSYSNLTLSAEAVCMTHRSNTAIIHDGLEHTWMGIVGHPTTLPYERSIGYRYFNKTGSCVFTPTPTPSPQILVTPTPTHPPPGTYQDECGTIYLNSNPGPKTFDYGKDEPVNFTIPVDHFYPQSYVFHQGNTIRGGDSCWCLYTGQSYYFSYSGHIAVHDPPYPVNITYEYFRNSQIQCPQFPPGSPTPTPYPDFMHTFTKVNPWRFNPSHGEVVTFKIPEEDPQEPPYGLGIYVRSGEENVPIAQCIQQGANDVINEFTYDTEEEAWVYVWDGQYTIDNEMVIAEPGILYFSITGATAWRKIAYLSSLTVEE